MTENITASFLRELTNNQDAHHPLAQKYKAWRKLDSIDSEAFTKIASVKSAYQELTINEFPTSENYWSEHYPIALDYYPNNGCELFKCNNLYFLVYVEFGGHVPERRCRFVRYDLII